jgi:acyl carrier protein
LNALLATSGGAGVLPRRFLFLGGEASSWDLIAKVREVSSCRIINHYGPTETTIGSLTYPVPAEPLTTATVPIGRPIANTKIYLLDSRQNPVPVGIPGELYIGGDGVADGYIEQPELTESRFVLNPFTNDGSRMYRTGDVARYLPDGNVEFLGRGDDQVKIRGFRVEPGEVEAVLRTHPGVHQAVVVSREDGGDKRLVGYYVAPAQNAPTSEDLKAHLHETLPDYMVPASLIRLPSLPLNANGKVDRAALPAPETLVADASHERIAPRTPVEQQLAAMWAETLGNSDFGIHDDFFELGGHSLMAIRVMSRVRETFRVEIAMNALFDAPTVASLAEVIAAEQSALTDALMDDLDNLSEEEVEALLAQERARA